LHKPAVGQSEPSRAAKHCPKLAQRERRRENSLALIVCEDKEKKMSSLYTKNYSNTPEMVTIPAFCVPAEVSAELAAKRAAQLEWMRSKGIQYILGQPIERHTPYPEHRRAA
jgi:hypothetical protein